jgi:hypothetical protein
LICRDTAKTSPNELAPYSSAPNMRRVSYQNSASSGKSGLDGPASWGGV